MKAKLLTSALVAVGALLGSAAHAQFVLNYDAPGFYGANYVGLGAAPDNAANTYWNALPGSGGTTGSPFSDLLSDGATSTSITLTLSSYNTYNNGSGSPNTPVTGLLAPFIIAAGTSTGTLNNIPNGTYDLYLYGANWPDADRAASFTVNGSTQSTLGINWNVANHTYNESTFVQGGSFNNAGAGGAVGPNAVAGANYVEFANLTVSSGSLMFSWTANPIDRPGGLSNQDYSGINGEGDFNGLQLVQVVPEPSTVALGGLGLLGFLGSRKRRQRGN